MGRADSPLKDRVAFLVGVRRSGTNWLRRIVDAHPDAAVIPSETYLMSHGLAPLVERVQHGLRGSARTGTMFVDRDRFHDALRDLCDSLLLGHLDGLDRPVRVLGERTPDHVRVLDLIGDVFPDAAIVHITRDGRDVARSLVSQTWGPTSYREAALEWVSGIDAARAAAPSLDRYLEIGYEQLLAAPLVWVPELYRFLGLDDGPDVVARAIAEAEVPYNVDPAATQVVAQKWRGGLTEEQLAEVLAVAGPRLAELGYDVGDAARRAPRDRPSVAARARSAIGAVRRRSSPRGGFQRQVLDELDTTMALVDDLMADIVARRFDRLPGHFAEDARIRVLGSGMAWDARGAGAVARFGEVLAADPALAGRQVRGDVHPAVPAFTIVSTWEAEDGTVSDRVLLVGRYGDRIDELTWYRLPRLTHQRGGGAR
jgi:hypothetical protein